MLNFKQYYSYKVNEAVNMDAEQLLFIADESPGLLSKYESLFINYFKTDKEFRKKYMDLCIDTPSGSHDPLNRFHRIPEELYTDTFKQDKDFRKYVLNLFKQTDQIRLIIRVDSEVLRKLKNEDPVLSIIIDNLPPPWNDRVLGITPPPVKNKRRK